MGLTICEVSFAWYLLLGEDEKKNYLLTTEKNRKNVDFVQFVFFFFAFLHSYIYTT